MNPSLAVVTLNGILVSLLQIPHGYDVDFFCLNSIVPTWWGWNDILVYIGSSSRFLASWTQVSCSWVVACRCNYLCRCSVCRLIRTARSIKEWVVIKDQVQVVGAIHQSGQVRVAQAIRCWREKLLNLHCQQQVTLWMTVLPIINELRALCSNCLSQFHQRMHRSVAIAFAAYIFYAC